MIDYHIQPNTRRCSVTGRELQPGERYYSVLLDEAGRFLRRDYSVEAWQGPPSEAFSFWTGRVPPPQGSRRLAIDDELLMDCFVRLQGQQEPGRCNFRYVVALLLMRHRRLKFEEVRHEDGQEVLTLRCVRTGARHAVVNPGLTEEQMAAAQDEVFQALGWGPDSSHDPGHK
jgi:hypothetical protein